MGRLDGAGRAYVGGSGMTGLMICAAVAIAGMWALAVGGVSAGQRQDGLARILLPLGAVLIAVALWLAYAAGGA